jgi:hypothetical protein
MQNTRSRCNPLPGLRRRATTYWETSSCDNVQTDLDAAERPGTVEDAVEIRARSSFGVITVHRVPTQRTTR